MREIQTQTDTSPETKSPRKTVYSKSHPQTVRNRAESRKEISAPTRQGLKIQFFIVIIYTLIYKLIFRKQQFDEIQIQTII